MSNVYKNLVDYAYCLVNIVNKKYLNGNSMAYTVFLLGIGNYLVEGIPGSGHNYQAVVDAFHLFYKDFPDSDVNVRLQDGIFNIISNATKIKTVQIVFNYITYELKKEKENSNSFCLDCQKLLDELHKRINENYSNFKMDYLNIDNWLKDSALYVEKNFGYHF